MASLKFALAGNPNCGKTTMFNALTGANQYVGNWPGVTVEKKEGKLKGHSDMIVTDLPGIYSLSPYTLEEVVSRKYITEEKPDCIIDLVDATNLERNLYLTTQLLEMGTPVVIALNMMDVVRKTGDQINTNALSKELGVPVVEISALRNEGLDKLISTAIETAQSKKMPSPSKTFGSPMMELTEDEEEEVIASRYDYIGSIIGKVLKKKHTGMTASDKIDQIVTNRFLALPIFAVVMFVVYYVAVSSLGTIVTDWTNDTLFGEWIQPAVQGFLENAGAAEWLVSLVVDGIIGGLAAPIGFAPQMAIVFFFLTLLEDCGYMARVAFIMDRIFRRFGLSGKSFIPFLISSGCGVPGIMGTRTIENEKDRRMTMITTTFIPCGAKLPVIALIAGFLMGGAWWMAPLMYFLGIGAVIVACIIMKKTRFFNGEPAPFVMELPQYHFPSLKNVLLHVWERVWSFLKKAGTVLFVCCAVMWFLGTFGIQEGVFGMVDTDYCFLSYIGGAIAWIFAPLGFGTWQAVAASLSGFVAKEGIVSTMGVLAGLGEVEEYAADMHAAFAAFFPTSIAAVSFLVFNLLDSPCLAAISTMAREMHSKKGVLYALLFQNIFAYCIAMMVYQIGGLITGQVAFSVFTVVAFALVALLLFLLFRPDPETKKSGVAARARA